MPALIDRHCQSLSAGTPPLAASEIEQLIAGLHGWVHRDGVIRKCFEFSDFGTTMAFVNAVAWIAQREDHHPNMTVSYNRCEVAYQTHSIGGISINDFICALKVEALL